MVALCVGVLSHRLELVSDLIFRRDQLVILINCGASETLLQVHDEGGDVGGFPPD